MKIAELNALQDILHRGSADHPADSAVSCLGGSCVELSYGRLREAAAHAGAKLRRDGLSAGDRILLAAESGPLWAVAFFAALESGAVVVPVPVETPPEAIASVARRAQARTIIAGERNARSVAGIDTLRTIPAAVFADVQSESGPPAPPVTRQDSALLALTSGTTAEPRLVELTHGALLANLEALLEVRQAGPGDKFLSMLPLAHMFELVVGLLAPLACGAHIVYAGALLPNRIIDTIRAAGVTHALTVPALVTALYNEILSRLAEKNLIEGGRRRQVPAVTARRLQSELSSDKLLQIRLGVRNEIGSAFEGIMVGGAAIDPALIDVLQALGIETDIGYGLTEAGPVVSIGRSAGFPPLSVGRPLPRVAVSLSAEGEILVKSPAVMRSYFGDPEATAAAVREGWLRTGDFGKIDDDGYLYVAGRLKEAMVTASGETIHPDEMEPYYQSPHFSEFCVAKVPGPHGNDVPALFVVPAQRDLPDGDLEQIFAGLRAAAPARMRVEQLFREERPLPRSATGKVRRRLLIDRHAHQGVLE